MEGSDTTPSNTDQLNMEHDVLYAVMWFNIRVCLPFTFLIIVLCYFVRTDYAPVYYINLLVANLIKLCLQAVWVSTWDHQYPFDSVSYGMVSLGFRACIALERYLFISRPLLQCIRQRDGYVLVCVLVWVLPSVVFYLAEVTDMFLLVPILVPLFGPVFIICLIGTLKSLPASTSVPPEIKRRIVGTLVLFLLNYTLMILPLAVWYIYMITLDQSYTFYGFQISYILFHLSYSVDMILFVFMRKGPVDKLLTCLCCCRMENTAADHQCE